MNILVSLALSLSVFCNSVSSELPTQKESEYASMDCSCCVIGDYFDKYPTGPGHDPSNPAHAACYDIYLQKHEDMENQLIAVIKVLCLPCIPGEQYMRCCPCVKSVYENNLWVEEKDLQNWIDYLNCLAAS